MLEALKGLLSSKKFWLSAVLGPVVLSVLVSVLPLLKVSPEHVDFILKAVAGFFGVALGGIGLADVGKEKAKLEKTP
jgi:hypothetical protein